MTMAENLNVVTASVAESCKCIQGVVLLLSDELAAMRIERKKLVDELEATRKERVIANSRIEMYAKEAEGVQIERRQLVAWLDKQISGLNRSSIAGQAKGALNAFESVRSRLRQKLIATKEPDAEGGDG